MCRHYVTSRIAHDGLPASCGKKKTNTASSDIAGTGSTQPYTYSQIQTLLELAVPSITFTARSRHCRNWQYPALHLQPDPDTAGTGRTQPYTYSQIQTLFKLAVPSLTARSRHCWNWQYPVLQPDPDTTGTCSTQPSSQRSYTYSLTLTTRSRHCSNWHWQYPALQPDPDTARIDSIQPLRLQPDPDTVGTGST